MGIVHRRRAVGNAIFRPPRPAVPTSPLLFRNTAAIPGVNLGRAKIVHRVNKVLQEPPLRVVQFALLVFGAFGIVGAHAQTPEYRGIPDGFDFPADKASLELARAAGNMTALRRHGWMLFAGMSEMTPTGMPTWATWYRVDEAFAPARLSPAQGASIGDAVHQTQSA